MSDKILQTRIKQKIDTKANWDKAVNFVPLKGEIIVYSDLNKIKVGDGAKKVSELPFLADSDTHQSIKALNTNNTSAQTVSSSEAIAGSGTINLHKVAKTGSYNDLNDKPTNLVTTNTDQTVTGTKDFSAITATSIGTGSDANNYFQSQKFRGEGDANTYYHAVDFGYAGHNQVDFYEYGGNYNFYINTQANTDSRQLLFGINPSGIKIPPAAGAKVLGTNAEGQVESHSLGIADISSLQSALDGKVNSSSLATVATSGSYSDLSNKPAINNGQLTVQKNGTTVATFTANQGGNTTANITVPTKLADLSDRTFSNITSRGEEYLDWGGTSHSGSVSPIGMCLSAEHSANRVALINPNALTFEYSSDGGTTWTAYSYAGADKTKFCTTSLSLSIGRPNSSTNLVANKSKTRITITAQNGTNGYVYTSLKKMLVQVSTATTLSLLVETRTGTNYKNNGAWSSVGTYNLSGWSGWNDIPTLFSLGGGTTQTGTNWQMRLTITCTTASSSYPQENIRSFQNPCRIPCLGL